jgi:hypothetical protein
MGAAIAVVACGTDNGTTPTPMIEAGSPKDSGGGGTDSGPMDMDSSTPVDGGDSGVDCSKNPVLHDFTTGFRCPFVDSGIFDGGQCLNTETCCETSDKVGANYQPSYCAVGKNGDTTCQGAAAANGSTFNTGDAWECNDNKACGGTGVCCMIISPGQADAGKTLNIGNTLASDTKHPPACGVKRAFNEGGSRCRAGTNCPAGEIKLCSLSDMNCGAGTKCTPFVDFQQTHHGACQ